MARTLKDYINKKMKNPKDRAAYINAALEDGDPKILLAVLKDCVVSLEGNNSIFSRASKASRVLETGSEEVGG